MPHGISEKTNKPGSKYESFMCGAMWPARIWQIVVEKSEENYTMDCREIVKLYM